MPSVKRLVLITFLKTAIIINFLVFNSFISKAQNNQSDLFLSLSSNTAIAQVGDNVSFTINVKNNGFSNASNVRITDVLPSGFTFVSANPNQGSFNNPIWTLGNFPVNATATITIVAKVNPFGNYANTAAIKADEPDPNLNDNFAKISIGVIRAIDDYAYVNANFSGAVINNILVNDFINGTSADISKVNIVQVSTSNPEINIETGTGKVTVNNSLPSGNYNLVYKISDKNNPLLSSTANINISISTNNQGNIDAPILATHDAGQVPEITGGIAVANVLANDKVAGQAATLANVNLEFVSSSNPNITLDVSSGKVIVAPNTPGGPYILNYKITDKNDVSISAITYVTVNVSGTGSLDLNDDFGSANSITGGITVQNVLQNDLLNGSVINIVDVSLTKLFSNSPGIDLDLNTGSVSVAAGTPNGFYTLTYQVSENSNPANKGAADVIITVTGGPNLIKANEDNCTANGTTGGIALENVLANDDFGGAPPLINQVNLYQVFSNNSAINLNYNTGQIIVNPGTKNGFYTITYVIEDKTNNAFSSFADVIVEINGGLSQLIAKEDAGSVYGISGGIAVNNILANDDLEGHIPVLSEVILTQIFTNNIGISLDVNTGQVIVAPGTANGVYTLAYNIEDKLKPESTSYADVIITVTEGNVNILANPDNGNVDGGLGGIALQNVLANDFFKGAVPQISDVNLLEINTDNPGIHLNLNNGAINVAAGTPQGIYTLTYSISDKLNLNDVSTTTVTVTVNVTPSIIEANEDKGTVNASGGLAVFNVLANDKLNGKAPLISEVKISQLFTNQPNVVLDSSTGNVTVAPNTPEGFYTVTYQIEERLNTGNTASADIIIEVNNDASVILAVDDAGQINNAGGVVIQNVMINDLLNGAPANLSNIDLTQISSDNAGISLDVNTGIVNVAAGLPFGDYILKYQITDKTTSNSSSEATVRIKIFSNSPIAVDDAGSVNGFNGGVVVNNVVVNDKFKNAPALFNDVSLSQISTTNSNITLNPTTGQVSVAPNTLAGTYTIIYRLADKLNSNDFSNANVLVTVNAPSISALDDSGAINGLSGGIVINNILINDSFNGVTATLANVNISQITVNPNINIDVATGKVNILPNTPAGIYVINYQITDKINPSNSAQAKITITVTAPAILATDDAASINGFLGGEAIANILVNDSFNGVTATLTDVKISQITVNPKISIDAATGKVNILPNTPAGIYIINYQITDKLNPSNSAQAKITITVTAPTILATDDAASINGFLGGEAIANILVNDSFNGVTATLANVKISQITVNQNINIDVATGKVNILPNTPAGIYVIKYQITDKINPSNSAQAKITITVTAPTILVTDDAATINGFLGGQAIANILINDSFNGVTATLANVNISQITVNPNIIIDVLTGKVNVLANTPAGIYVINYQITDKINPSNSAQAKIIITVKPRSILAVDDAATVNVLTTTIAIDNILANDFLNDQATNLSRVNIVNINPNNPNILVDAATGKVTILQGILAGIYTINYTIEDKDNPSINSTAKVLITVNPLSKLGISKLAALSKKQINGSFDVTYTLNVKNHGNTPLNDIGIQDDLTKTFVGSVVFNIVGTVNATGTLKANPFYNGKFDVQLLSPGSTLIPSQTESISFTVNVIITQPADSVFYNIATGLANSLGGNAEDESTNGINPDPNNDNNPSENEPTPITLIGSDSKFPAGFSPNNDGVHDKFVIENTAGKLVSLEVYNRWGNVVYKNEDYKNDWTGIANKGVIIGQDLPDGTYYYVVIVDRKDKYVKYLTIKR
ncbi:hypothetical protein A5893_03950 [Pedobacter psychrophilus]|uniref:Cadherin domain-containing protein n=1 Tax=Pedobacter psychrophilus TaxID=1826909 RepID=A0A179DMW3_9SPHI|nr:gliding motility-associated C-terminal domain-containing protein [Pedobacter psychrophilus]OAQ42274.1 hypothetical protein A5893_03950 [Pedobacter psychrophilus]